MIPRSLPQAGSGRIPSLLAALVLVLFPVPRLSAQPVAEQLKGYWGLDAEAVMDGMMEGLEGADERQREYLKMQIRKMAVSFVLRFGDEGRAELSSPQGPNEGTYTIENPDEEADTFRLTMVPKGEAGNAVEARIEGDKLTFTPPTGQVMIFRRIGKAEYEQRRTGGGKKEESPAPAPETPGEPDQ